MDGKVQLELQSLFFWQLYCNLKHVQERSSQMCTEVGVTILVFLAALLQLIVFVSERDAGSFKLQSLFFWQLYCNGNSREPTLSGTALQSLFFWQLYCNEQEKIYNTRELIRYNPCFSGSSIATGTHPKKCGCMMQVTILVFLAALLQRYKRHRYYSYRTVCYNPCFSGSSIATKHKRDYDQRRLGYNPCFSGSSIAT